MVDPERIILSGASAGANLIIAIALRAKKTQDFRIAQMILAYPPLDLVTDPEEKLLSRTPEELEGVETARLYNDWYAPAERRGEIECSPVYATAEDLIDLPPMAVITASEDVLCAEAEKFALKLVQAGVVVTARRVFGAKHGFLMRRAAGFEKAEEVYFRAVRNVIEG